MKKEYDFSKAIKNPYIDKQLKKQISMNINADTIEYFKNMANKFDFFINLSKKFQFF